MLEELVLRELVEQVEASGFDLFLVLNALALVSQGDKEAASWLPPELAKLVEYAEVLSPDRLWREALKYY